MGVETERPWGLRESYLFDRPVIAEIQRAASQGIYDIRGFGAKRRLPHFDDLLFLGASISRYPLEGYREKCATDVVLGTRFARKPLELKIPAGTRSGRTLRVRHRGITTAAHQGDLLVTVEVYVPEHLDAAQRAAVEALAAAFPDSPRPHLGV